MLDGQKLVYVLVTEPTPEARQYCIEKEHHEVEVNFGVVRGG